MNKDSLPDKPDEQVSHYEQQARELEEMGARDGSLRAKNAMNAAAADLRELETRLARAVEQLRLSTPLLPKWPDKLLAENWRVINGNPVARSHEAPRTKYRDFATGEFRETQLSSVAPSSTPRSTLPDLTAIYDAAYKDEWQRHCRRGPTGNPNDMTRSESHWAGLEAVYEAGEKSVAVSAIATQEWKPKFFGLDASKSESWTACTCGKSTRQGQVECNTPDCPLVKSKHAFTTRTTDGTATKP